jgi:hypothetical protein
VVSPEGEFLLNSACTFCLRIGWLWVALSGLLRFKVQGTPQLISGQYVQTLSATNQTGFFRLHKLF